MNSCTNGSSTKLSSTSNPPGALELLPYAADIVCRARIAYLLFCLIVATTLDASALMIAANDIAFDDGEEDNSLIAILLSYPSALSLSRFKRKRNDTKRHDTTRNVVLGRRFPLRVARLSRGGSRVFSLFFLVLVFLGLK